MTDKIADSPKPEDVLNSVENICQKKRQITNPQSSGPVSESSTDLELIAKWRDQLSDPPENANIHSIKCPS